MADNFDDLEQMDIEMHDCMATIWRSYREAVAKNNYDIFNDCFEVLRDKYKGEEVNSFITCMGTGLISAMTKQSRRRSPR